MIDQDARDRIEKMFEYFPETLGVLKGVAEGADGLARAVTRIDDAPRVNPDDRWARLRRAAIRLMAGEASARDDFEALSISPPPNASTALIAEIWRLLSSAQVRNGEAGRALASLDEALRLEPACVDAIRARAFLLMEMGRDGEAKASFRRGLTINPRDSEMAHNLATILIREGELEQASEVCYAVTATGVADPNIAVNAVVTALQVGSMARFKRLIDVCLNQFPDNLRLTQAGYHMATECGDYAIALERADAATLRDPDIRFQNMRLSVPISA